MSMVNQDKAFQEQSTVIDTERTAHGVRVIRDVGVLGSVVIDPECQ